jgi:hypothetical protein
MDCKTARTLLDFVRPTKCELEAEETGALESYLDQCADCHTLARGERQFDQWLGKAMRQVDVPSNLRGQLVARLEAERIDWYRQRFAHQARLAVAAAAVILLGWAGWHWLHERAMTPVAPEQVAEAKNNEAGRDPRVRAEEALKRLGVETPLSPHLNYNLLISDPTLAELPGYLGRKVPLLLFERGGRRAWVYLVPEKLIQDGPMFAGGGTFKAELLPAEGEPYRFLVLHDGDNLDWLRPPDPAAA